MKVISSHQVNTVFSKSLWAPRHHARFSLASAGLMGSRDGQHQYPFGVCILAVRPRLLVTRVFSFVAVFRQEGTWTLIVDWVNLGGDKHINPAPDFSVDFGPSGATAGPAAPATDPAQQLVQVAQQVSPGDQF